MFMDAVDISTRQQTSPSFEGFIDNGSIWLSISRNRIFSRQHKTLKGNAQCQSANKLILSDTDELWYGGTANSGCMWLWSTFWRLSFQRIDTGLLLRDILLLEQNYPPHCTIRRNNSRLRSFSSWKFIMKNQRYVFLRIIGAIWNTHTWCALLLTTNDPNEISSFVFQHAIYTCTVEAVSGVNMTAPVSRFENRRVGWPRRKCRQNFSCLADEKIVASDGRYLRISEFNQ